MDDKLLTNVNLFKLTKFLFLNKIYNIRIILVKNTPNYKLDNEYNPYGYKLSFTKFGKNFNSRYVETQYLISNIELEQFIYNKQIDDEFLLLENKSDEFNFTKNIIFIFEDISWFYLRTIFKDKKNIILRGTSANKSHELAPLEERM